MDFPKFKYSPNAYSIGVFEEIPGKCSACGEERNIKYVSSFYSTEDPEYICPWCIVNGKAAEKYEGTFNDYNGTDINFINENNLTQMPSELIEEITKRTPSYSSWQQEVWLSHCNQPCAFVGYADAKIIQPYLIELEEDIYQSGIEPEHIKKFLSKDGSLVGYLFKCLKCGKHRLHVDSD